MQSITDKAIKDENSALTNEQKTYVAKYLTTQTVTVVNSNGTFDLSLKYGECLADVIFANDNCQIPDGYDNATFSLSDGNEYDIYSEVTENVTVKETFWKAISTLEDLRAITGTSGNYILMNDIDVGKTYNNTEFLGNFSGVLDGN